MSSQKDEKEALLARSRQASAGENLLREAWHDRVREAEEAKERWLEARKNSELADIAVIDWIRKQEGLD